MNPDPTQKRQRVLFGPLENSTLGGGVAAFFQNWSPVSTAPTSLGPPLLLPTPLLLLTSLRIAPMIWLEDPILPWTKSSSVWTKQHPPSSRPGLTTTAITSHNLLETCAIRRSECSLIAQALEMQHGFSPLQSMQQAIRSAPPVSCALQRSGVQARSAPHPPRLMPRSFHPLSPCPTATTQSRVSPFVAWLTPQTPGPPSCSASKRRHWSMTIEDHTCTLKTRAAREWRTKPSDPTPIPGRKLLQW